ncbi:MAG: replication initiator protein A [Cetobacterium sp.]|uniref:replication initiator protein A n=2 Tax=Cetobacterium sp. TaxID=2071632 RepID=UPI003EE4A98D
MSRMKIKDFKKLEFYQLPKWLLKVNGLKPVDIVVYTLAFNNWKLSVKNNLVNENEEIYFFMTHEGIRDEIEIGKDQVIDSIKRLVESKVIIQEKFQGKATRFYLEDDLNQIKFKDVKNTKSSRKKSTTENPTTPVGKSDHTSTEIPTANQSENKDINKTILLNKTNLKRIMTHEEHDLFENLFEKIGVNFTTTNQKSIKKLLKTLSKEQVEQYLLETYENMRTNPNIENLEGAFSIKIITGERQSKYKELEIDIPKPEIESQEKKELGRGHKINLGAMDSTLEAKELKEEYTAKIDRLQLIYQGLSDTEKKTIDTEAYEKALKEYGPAVAKIMFRTKTKFEVLEKYYSQQKGV